LPFLTGRRRYADRFLEWKVAIFSIAGGVALVGIYFEERWMTGAALALLLGATLLRFLPGAGPRDSDEADDKGAAEESLEDDDPAAPASH